MFITFNYRLKAKKSRYRLPAFEYKTTKLNINQPNTKFNKSYIIILYQNIS
jgi:hypothetical protein